MKSFREFLEQSASPWHASKGEVLTMWRNLKPTPIQMRPVPEVHRGTRFHIDGVRLTGTPQFINSVLSRLKDLLQYEDGPGTSLDLEYRQIDTANSVKDNAGFVCYIHVRQDVEKAKRLLKASEPKLTPPSSES